MGESAGEIVDADVAVGGSASGGLGVCARASVGVYWM